MLLVPSRGPTADARAAVAELVAAHPGRTVEPLHITCDRYAGPESPATLVDELRRGARGLRPVAVRAVSLMQLRRPSGRSVLKYIVEDTPDLIRIRDAVRAAASTASLTSAYGRDVAWNVSAVEGVAGTVALRDIAPLPLFTADQFLVSRIVGDGLFETVAEIGLGPGG